MEDIDIQLSRIFFDAGEVLPDWLVIFLASYLIWVMGILIIFFIKKKSNDSFRPLIKIIVSASLAYSISILIGFLFFRQRPFNVLGIDAIIGTNHLDKSFPSSHAAVAFSIAGILFLEYKKSASIFFALAILISLGRSLAGVHYLGDIIGGAVVGLVSAWIIYYFLKRRNRN